MAKHLVQVQEWKRVELPAELDSPIVRQKILRAGETSIGAAFSIRRNRLYARGLVGLVDAGPVQVQVVPKLYADSSTSDDAELLLRLIADAALPRRAAVRPSLAKLSGRPVTEAVFKFVADELHRLLLLGIPRRYQEVNGLDATIRGRVDIGRLSRRHPGQQHLVPIRHCPLQNDNALTRLLRALAEHLQSLSRVGSTRASLGRTASALGEARRCALSVPLVDAVQPSRLEADWSPIVAFARLVAQSLGHDAVRAGKSAGFGLMFALDGLFESLLRSTVRRGLIGSPLRLRRGKSAGRLLKRGETGLEAFSIKPDLIIGHRASGDWRVAADAKWKRLDHSKKTFGISQADVYQLLSYVRRMDVESGVLFFPQAVRCDAVLRRYPFESLTDGRAIEVVEVQVEAMLSDDPHVQAQTDAAFRELFVELGAANAQTRTAGATASGSVVATN